MTLGILLPTFALVALVYIVWITMFVQRFGHMRKRPPTDADLATGEAAMRYFSPVEMPANNFRNLFEMPVLYFGLVPLLLIADAANIVQVTLAWVFVALRAVHSYIHIGPKKVPLRAAIYGLSCLVLAVMWVGFAIDVTLAEPPYVDHTGAGDPMAL
jgi:hypothetical protein